MESVVLYDFDWELDTAALARAMHLRDEARHMQELQRLAEAAKAVGRPKAMYRQVFIEEKGEDYVICDGVRFTSRVLRVNLEVAHRAFVYCVTCGAELVRWTSSVDDMLQHYWAEAIQQASLRVAIQALNDHLAREYHLLQAASQAPGSLPSWPIDEQRPLFQLLGDTEEAIGVRLTSHLMMNPAKSVSGIRFPTETSFESCQLCARESCPGRRVPYDAGLYERRYRPPSS